MTLLDLPADIINILPHYFNSIYDLYNVLLTCRTLRAAYGDTEIRLPPILPKPDGQLLFQPHPHLLLTIVARQIGDWAVSSSFRRYELYKTLLNGYDGLLSLAERVTVVSLSDLRHLHVTKYSVLNPLARLVDFEAGPAMVRNQDMDPAEYGLTICLHPDIAVLNYIVYCELFHLYVDHILASSEVHLEKNKTEGHYDHISESQRSSKTVTVRESTELLPRPLEAGIRHRFIAHCLPDPNNHRNPDYNSLGAGRDNEWQLLDYIKMSQSSSVSRRNKVLKRYWDTGVLQAIPDDERGIDGVAWDWQPSIAEKRERLFVVVASHLGYESLGMLLLDGMSGEKINARLKEIRMKVQGIPKESIDAWEFWNHSEESVSEIPLDDQRYAIEWRAWLGMASDCHEGVSTNQASDEDLQTEAETWEGLLMLDTLAEQEGIRGKMT